MSIGVLTVCYRDERFMHNCIRQFRGLVDEHLVLVSDDPWHGEAEPLDRCAEYAEKEGARTIVGNWLSEKDQRNFGVKELSRHDWILIVDTDERYLRHDVQKMIGFLETANLSAYGIGRLKTYWKDIKTIIEPEESGGLIVAVRPSVRFTEKRCIDSEWYLLPQDIVMHHLSYVRTDSEMRRKIATFEHYHEIQKNWYEEKWLTGKENLHPVHPESFKKLKKTLEVVEI